VQTEKCTVSVCLSVLQWETVHLTFWKNERLMVPLNPAASTVFHPGGNYVLTNVCDLWVDKVTFFLAIIRANTLVV